MATIYDEIDSVELLVEAVRKGAQINLDALTEDVRNQVMELLIDRKMTLTEEDQLVIAN